MNSGLATSLFLFFLGASPAALLRAQTPVPRSTKPKVPTISVSPTLGTSIAQTFVMTYSDDTGIADVQNLRLLINGSIDGRHACYIYYVPQTDAMVLVNDDGDGSQSVKSEKPAGIRNDQCTLSPGSRASRSGTTLTVQILLTFNPKFTGTKNLYTYVERKDKDAIGFDLQGTWIAPTLPPPPGTSK